MQKTQERFSADANIRELLYKDEVFLIIGAAMEVSRNLGRGFLEAVYQEAFELELKGEGIPFESQKRLSIHYKENILQKEYIADIVCYENIVVEIKAIKRITEVEEAQLLNYLKVARMPLGLIINFGAQRFEWKRYANTNKANR
jgi:GxxExxY protein